MAGRISVEQRIAPIRCRHVDERDGLVTGRLGAVATVVGGRGGPCPSEGIGVAATGNGIVVGMGEFHIDRSTAIVGSTIRGLAGDFGQGGGFAKGVGFHRGRVGTGDLHGRWREVLDQNGLHAGRGIGVATVVRGDGRPGALEQLAARTQFGQRILMTDAHCRILIAIVRCGCRRFSEGEDGCVRKAIGIDREGITGRAGDGRYGRGIVREVDDLLEGGCIAAVVRRGVDAGNGAGAGTAERIVRRDRDGDGTAVVLGSDVIQGFLIVVVTQHRDDALRRDGRCGLVLHRDGLSAGMRRDIAAVVGGRGRPGTCEGEAAIADGHRIRIGM